MTGPVFYPLRFGQRVPRMDWWPMHGQRLLNSGFVARAVVESPEGGFFAMLLWNAAIWQDPAGTLPDDDVQLAQLARLGADVARWRAVRDFALYRWTTVLVGDADMHETRLGHPVITEIVMDMVSRDRTHRAKSAAGGTRKRLKRLRETMRAVGCSSAQRQNLRLVEALDHILLDRGVRYRSHARVEEALAFLQTHEGQRYLFQPPENRASGDG